MKTNFRIKTIPAIVIFILPIASCNQDKSPENINMNRSVEIRNNLNTSSSAYLLSAAKQPVNWQLWSEEAFELAASMNRPVLLDIGAVWCHWCHVMDRESYEDDEIARLINENFIAIKVDKDARPDIDKRYQTLLQAMGFGGGWPLTCFLTPDGKPFYGGTYFPPQSRGGMIGMKELLPQVSAYYSEKRDELLENSNRAFEIVKESANTNRDELSIELQDKIIADIKNRFDPVFGGFGEAPKFPNSSALEFALTMYSEKHDPKLLEIAEKTLQKMADGGINDQIGGGFHRYSVDTRWHVPHFEKMTEINAFILKNYIQLYNITKNDFYRKTAESIIVYYLRDMSDAKNGGFYAHQDADVDMDDDGSYFTWTLEEVKSVLTSSEAEIAVMYYGITEMPRSLREFPDRNILSIKMAADKIAANLNLDPESVMSRLVLIKSKMRDSRSKRRAPFIDKTLFADKNGMMISAFAEAYKSFGQDEIKEIIIKSLDLLIETGYEKNKGFTHNVSGKSDKFFDLLTDQVWMAAALLDGFEISGDIEYFQKATKLSDIIFERFQDHEEGGFFDRKPGAGKIAVINLDNKPFEDLPVPSLNSAVVRLFDRIFALTDDDRYNNAARKALESFAGNINGSGTFLGGYGTALYFHLNPPPQVIIIGSIENEITLQLEKTARNSFTPGMNVYLFDNNPAYLSMLPEAITSKIETVTNSDNPVAFVCTGFVCSAPVSSPDELIKVIKEF